MGDLFALQDDIDLDFRQAVVRFHPGAPLFVSSQQDGAPLFAALAAIHLGQDKGHDQNDDEQRREADEGDLPRLHEAPEIRSGGGDCGRVHGVNYTKGMNGAKY